MAIRGIEGGIIPSLKQTAEVHRYRDAGENTVTTLDPVSMQIRQETRAVPLPQALPNPIPRADGVTPEIDATAVAEATAAKGRAALAGEPGAAFDALVYGAAICLHQVGRAQSLDAAAEHARQVIMNGSALMRLEAAE